MFKQQYLALLLITFTISNFTSVLENTSHASTITNSSSASRDENFIHQLVIAGIQPLYRDLEQTSQQLTQASQTFCNTLSLEDFEKVRSAWGASMLAWQRTDSLLFGPAIADQVDFNINFSPPKKQILKNLLNQTTLITEQQLSEAGVGAQGLTSLEYVLFEPNKPASAMLELFKTAETGKIRCSYLQAASSLLEKHIRKVSTPWLSVEAEQQFSSNQVLIDTLIAKAYQTLEKVSLKKLAAPLSITNPQQATQAYDLESWRSAYSFKNIQANLEGIQRVFVNGGFLAWIKTNYPSEAAPMVIAAFEKQLTEAINFKFPEGDPFTLVEQRQHYPTLLEFYQRCYGLQMGVKRQLAVMTKAQLGFNDNDGD